MKNFATCSLFCFGTAGYSLCLADTPVTDEAIYQAVISADGVQHMQIEGGGYFLKPLSVIIKVVE